VRRSVTRKKTGNGIKAAFVAVAVLATAGVASYFAGGVHAAKAGEPAPSADRVLPSKSLSLPIFFEPNQGQTAPQVKFLARGAGYGLFLTADEAVLELRHAAHSSPFSVLSTQSSVPGSQSAASSVIRMRLEGANSSARISGASPLPGKSSYFIGNDPAKWHRDIPQFGRVQYEAVYPGVDLVYYGDQGQLEYDFRVAPAADPNQIALSFEGAGTHIDSGDLVLSTANGDVRFRAPHVYQPAAPQFGLAEKAVAGSFRQLADNKIGFSIGDYDRRRKLVIDPVLSYSTYLGGSGTESLVKVAVDGAGNIYVAGSTNSTDFIPTTTPPVNPPFQAHLAGAQNIFIAVINPFQPPSQQLLFATYLGGSGSDFAAGIAVSTDVDQSTSGIDVYVAGSTSSTNFPTNGVLAGFQAGPPAQMPGPHGFVTRLNFATTTTLRYSTYLSGTNAAGNAADIVTGLAIDNAGNAFVTGTTTSTNRQSDGFPANPNAVQTQSNAPSQFFASKINTKGSGSLSMIYSTYFGGGNPQSGQTQGGGIAVDTAGNMYITGGTNFLPTTGSNGEAKFPLNNAYQSCLDEASQTVCKKTNQTALDAFVAKITPQPGFTLPVYSTYLGGSGDDIGYGIAVDSSNNAYLTGSTTSGDWISPGTGFQPAYGTGGDAFIAKIGALTGSVYPLNYFTYLGGSGSDLGQAIQVDSLQAAHVTGSTTSCDFPTTPNTYESKCGGTGTAPGDAFVVSIGTTLSGQAAGDFSTYLGGTGLDQGTGVAIDIFGATYVAGTTQSIDFPTQNPLQPCLNNTAPAPPCPTSSASDAFVSKIGAFSKLTLAQPTTSPAPSPVAAGTQAAFTFDIINLGPDNASNVTFIATVPTTGVATNASAKVTSGGTGACNALQGSTISCFIPTLAACTGTCTTGAAVEVDVTPSITGNLTQVTVTGSVSANGGGTQGSLQQTDNVVDFTMTASTSTPTINAGDTATIQANFCPKIPALGYSATITPSQTTSPSMVTATTPTFNPTTVTLSGSACATTTLSIATVARPATTGSLFRRGSFHAAWLPIGGLSLVGLGLGAGRKRRRWLVGAVLWLIAGVVLLQAGCGNSSSTASTTGGTAAGTYTITINGSAGTGASHSTQVSVRVN
jgi:hypothetical protein